MGVDSEEKETDVLFLFDVGFSIEKIAESKKMPLEDVQKIIAKRGSQTRQLKQKTSFKKLQIKTLGKMEYQNMKL